MRSLFSKIAFTAALMLAMTFTFSCSGGDDNEGGGGSCNIGSYRTVPIGDQVWMAENLNCDIAGSKCYNNDPANCVKYGRLYNWATAMALPASCNSSSCASQISTKHKGICPSGWHIPSDTEWTTLTDFIGSNPGTKLKATSGWNKNSDVHFSASKCDESECIYQDAPLGTDIYGFAALPSGYGLPDGSFYNVGNVGDWWASSEKTSGNNFDVYRRNINCGGEYVGRNDRLQSIFFFSIRCVKD